MKTLDKRLAELRHTDFNVRARALASIVQSGRAATSGLLAALPDADVALKAQLVQALSEIADPAAADTLAGLLGNSDPCVRAFGAVGLARIRDGRGLAALVQTIDDFPDILRDPYTLSTYELISQGPPALAAVVPLLDAPSVSTRQHAFVVLHDILAAQPGLPAWPTLWQQLGSYAPDAPAPERSKAAGLWMEWLAGQPFAAPSSPPPAP